VIQAQTVQRALLATLEFKVTQEQMATLARTEIPEPHQQDSFFSLARVAGLAQQMDVRTQHKSSLEQTTLIYT
jgi:hypothetical protein